MISFKGQTVLITGAAGGIGRAVALLMARAGATIALCDIKRDALEALATEICTLGATASVHIIDIGSQGDCVQAATDIAQQYGGIDHLVHSAGIYPEMLIKDMNAEQWRRLMQINLDGTFYICQAVIPHLRERSSIVNLASVAGHKGSYAHAHYSASKGAVSSFSKSLALELAPRTRVNIVAPGIIETPMTADLLHAKGQALLNATPLHRFGTAEEVAGAIVFLCSDLAAFINAETIHVNGGLYIV